MEHIVLAGHVHEQGKIIETPPAKIIPLDLQGVALQDWQARIIETPGHTPGSVCYYRPKEGILFTGDTLFADGSGRTDLSYSSKNDLDLSLKKIFQLPEETKIFSGHGSEPTLNICKATPCKLFKG